MDPRYPLPELPGLPAAPSAASMAPLGPEAHTVIRVFLVNGESRSLRLDDRADVTVSGSLCVCVCAVRAAVTIYIQCIVHLPTKHILFGCHSY